MLWSDFLLNKCYGTEDFFLPLGELAELGEIFSLADCAYLADYFFRLKSAKSVRFARGVLIGV